MSCKRCKTDVHIETIKGSFGPHHLKVICTNCKSFIKWGSNKTTEEKTESKKQNTKIWYNTPIQPSGLDMDLPTYD